LIIEPAEPSGVGPWLDAIHEFHRQLIANHGVLPDSTPEIAANRHRDE
jgi:hypothetical protein